MVYIINGCYSHQFNLVVSIDLYTKIKKMRGPPKIVDTCVKLCINTIKKIRGPPKIVSLCATLGIFNIKK